MPSGVYLLHSFCFSLVQKASALGKLAASAVFVFSPVISKVWQLKYLHMLLKSPQSISQ